MICADTSVWVAFLNAETHEHVEKFREALDDNIVVMAPPVLSELISFPKLDQEDIELLSRLPIIELKKGYWQRVGQSRKSIIRQGLKARLADALIAQCCIDTKTPLLAIDQDFKHYIDLGLKLI